ncbi:MAG TPA: hypothetical protein VKV02_06645 [Acidobacteriaceae bacterium]|nr:hypothetical protein [Acidobacteriaceae bacterium]
MRRSAQVTAPLLASAAVALLSGCHHGPEMQRCVDAQNRVADPGYCQANAHGGYYGGTGGYHFYYGGSGNYAPGSIVTDGSTTPVPGHSYSMTSGTARGGFGSSFGGGHGEGGEGGGHGGGAGE